MSEETPEQKVNAASIDAADKPPAKGGGKPQYPFPRRTIEDALRVPTAIKTHNGGEPYDPKEIAKALGIGGSTGNFCGATLQSSAADLPPHIDTSDQPLPGPEKPTLQPAATSWKTPDRQTLKSAS